MTPELYISAKNNIWTYNTWALILWNDWNWKRYTATLFLYPSWNIQCSRGLLVLGLRTLPIKRLASNNFSHTYVYFLCHWQCLGSQPLSVANLAFPSLSTGPVGMNPGNFPSMPQMIPIASQLPFRTNAHAGGGVPIMRNTYLPAGAPPGLVNQQFAPRHLCGSLNGY